MRIAILGYGGVASVHVRGLLNGETKNSLSVFGPNLQKAAAFASEHGIAEFTNNIDEAISKAEVAIICSPSRVHFEQTQTALRAGLHTLVELPPCETADEAKKLGELAEQSGVVLQCAQTSHYLAPYERVAKAIESARLGSIKHVSYTLLHVLRERSWVDDALLHHAAHPLGLFANWFGELKPMACVTSPEVVRAQTVSLLARMGNGAPLTLSITYASRLRLVQMIIVGEQYTVRTDGFSYVESDLEELQFRGDMQAVYESAVHNQDAEFVRACEGEPPRIKWSDTTKLIGLIGEFRKVALGIGKEGNRGIGE